MPARFSYETLNLRVAAVNAANAQANKFYPIYLEAVRPFLGKKIKKVDGSFTKEFKKALPETPERPEPTIVPSMSDYTLSFCITAMKFTQEETHYFEHYLYIGDIRDGVLVALKEDRTPAKCDYTLEEVREKIAFAQRLENEFQEAKAQCFPFWDR